MHPVAYVDLVSLLACLAAVVFLIRGWRRPGLSLGTLILLIILLGLMVYYRTTLFLEWSRITTELVWIEDFVAVFIPFTWAFVFYAFVKNAVEDELRASRERFKALTESTSDWIWECDSQGVFTYCSPKVENLLGHQPSDVLGRTMFDYTTPAGRDHFRLTFEDAVRYGNAIRLEPVYFYGPDQQLLCLEISAVPIVDKHGRLTGFRGINRDITDRMRVEEALRRSEQRMNLALQGADLGTWDWNIETDDVTFDDRWAQMLGYTRDEIKAHADTWRELVHPDDLPYVMETLDRHLKGVTDLYETEHRLRHRSGRWVWVLDKGRVIQHDVDGKPLRACGTHLDITARKQAERSLLDYQQRLRSLASELSLAEERERRRIASGLHDYACQNLVFSKMKLQELRKPLPPPGANEIAHICHTLDETLESVRSLIFDLSSPTLYKFGLGAALKELLEDKLKSQHGIRYTFHDDGMGKPLAEDVLVLLFQSVRELLINVIKHAQANVVNVDVTRTNGTVQITVSDDGVGFDVAHVLTDPSRQQGFGLFNIKERLDFIGGRLDVDAHPGRGSRFTLVARLNPPANASQDAVS